MQAASGPNEIKAKIDDEPQIRRVVRSAVTDIAEQVLEASSGARLTLRSYPSAPHASALVDELDKASPRRSRITVAC